MVYDHFIGNTNCIHTVVFNVEDKPEVQLAQVRYWLHFLQSRVPPVEPLGEYTPFISRFFFRRFSARFCFAKFHAKNVVFNAVDKPENQLAQVRYWLYFLQSRVPPVEPLGEYLHISCGTVISFLLPYAN